MSEPTEIENMHTLGEENYKYPALIQYLYMKIAEGKFDPYEYELQQHFREVLGFDVYQLEQIENGVRFHNIKKNFYGIFLKRFTRSKTRLCSIKYDEKTKMDRLGLGLRLRLGLGLAEKTKIDMIKGVLLQKKIRATTPMEHMKINLIYTNYALLNLMDAVLNTYFVKGELLDIKEWIKTYFTFNKKRWKSKKSKRKRITRNIDANESLLAAFAKTLPPEFIEKPEIVDLVSDSD